MRECILFFTTAQGQSVTIATSDKDMMQLVSKDVRMYDIRDDKWIDRQDVIDKFGVLPHQVSPQTHSRTHSL